MVMLISLGVIIAAAFGVLTWAVFGLHAHDLQTAQEICHTVRENRMIERQIIQAAGLTQLHVPVTGLVDNCP